MRGFIIICIAFILTLSFVIAEELYVGSLVEKLIFSTEVENIKSKKELNDTLELWNRKEKILKWFINHKELEKISIELKTASKFYLMDNQTMYNVYMLRAREKIANLPNY